MSNDTSQSKAGLSVWIRVIILGVLNLAMLLFGLGLLALAIRDVHYDQTILEGGLFMMYVGGPCLLVGIFLVPATVLLMPRKHLPFWFQLFLLLMLIVGIITTAIAILYYCSG